MFSAMQNINIYKMKGSSTESRVQEAVAHFAFAVLLCIKQAQRCGIFVLEHPVGASSWSTQLASLLSQCPGTRRVNFDFCMLGMRSKDASGSAPAKKRTGVMTNSPDLNDTLAKFQFDSTHRCVVLAGGRPNACEEYPDEFCEVVLRAVQKGLGMKSTAQTLEVNTLSGGRDVIHELNLSMQEISCLDAKNKDREVR